MNIWLGNTPPQIVRNMAVTIGNFDGVHTGHRQILQRLSDEAAARNLASIAIIFEPQPTEFFTKNHSDKQPYRLTPLRDKLRLLRDFGCLNTVWVIRFNPSFAQMSAQDFIQKILIEQLQTKYLLIGDDFRFGKGRVGDCALLSQQTDFITEKTPSILVAGERASSTAIRQELANGDIAAAVRILGHEYTLSGHVKHGKKLGRTIGCPTANIHLPPHRYALNGVFIVKATGAFGSRFGVASFGKNPTVTDTLDTKLEVHLFDFSGNLYGNRLEIAFLHKLRDEAKFDSLDALTKQIQNDIQAAKTWLATS